ncbi:hypothetical protein MRB53_003822 [Persea americana]|uniref:Uncharacterized protein n=1 Tax=Persea americana TaxID=3435 RepID=A0ACC2MYR1_PERAE|nr:hypothetical protein MRB53_003822 [Persea americana]
MIDQEEATLPIEVQQEELAITTFKEWLNPLEDTSSDVAHSFNGPTFSPKNHDDELQHIGPSTDSALPVANNIPSSELNEGPSMATPMAATNTSTTAIDTWHNHSLSSTTSIHDTHDVLASSRMATRGQHGIVKPNPKYSSSDYALHTSPYLHMYRLNPKATK